MILKFIDRKEEFGFLDERYKGKSFEFFVIYGRRRIGKTELIKHFLKDKPHIYLLCDKSGLEQNISRFKAKIAEHLKEPAIATDDLEEIFKYLAKKKERLVVVFDEFSYLVEKDDVVPSLFQVAIDEALKNTDLFLILCGSSISMMEKGVLSYKSPLYGRKTAHLRMNPTAIGYFHDFFPSNKTERNIEFYAILGGIPFYLEKFSDGKSALENVKEQILDKKGKLYEEIDFLLREELREPDAYKAIISAIAAGNTKVVEIANRARINVQDMDKYLKVLIRLGIVKKEIPVTEEKSRKSIYSIDDNFYSFSFLFSEPFKSDLEIGETKNAEEKLKREFTSFVGKRFEKLIREEILRKTGITKAEKIGRWWGHYSEEGERKAVEIDAVALNEKTRELLACECKWKSGVDASKIARELSEKTEHIDWHNKSRKESYAIFAKSFSSRIKEFDGKQVHCFDLQDIEKIIKE